MKHFVAVFFLLLIPALSFAETIRISVPEMECDHCSGAVEARLKLEKEIEKVETDAKARVVTVVLKDGEKLSDEKLRELVKDAGFSSDKIERL